jgi:glycosyltransferase involved in cell wall biosynthesis
MKIALIHHHYAAFDGGMEAYLNTLIDGFLARGDTVDIHVSYTRDLPSKPKFGVHRYPSFYPGKFKTYGFFNAINKKFDRGQYDLSISLTRTAVQDLYICGGVHAAFVTHLAEAGLRKPTRSRNFFDALDTRYERKTMEQSTKIVAHSTLLKDEMMAAYGLPSDKVSVVYPAVKALDVAGELPDVNPNKCTVLFPSCDHRRKGLDVLLGAMVQLPEDKFECLVAGHGKSHAAGNVRYVGYVKNIGALYGAVDAMVLPAVYEPFGLVVPEALACGTPVVVSQRVGASELLQPEDGVVLAHRDVPTLVAALERIANHKMKVNTNVLKDFDLTVDEHIQALLAIS